MRFWDSSALVPLIVDEEQTEVMKSLLREDRDVVVSFITRLEVDSAIWRRVRHNDEAAQSIALRRITALADEWTIVNDIDHTLLQAHRLVRRHGLRSADAIQLAAALLIGPEDVAFVTSDDELRAAARSEGFTILP